MKSQLKKLFLVYLISRINNKKSPGNPGDFQYLEGMTGIEPA